MMAKRAEESEQQRADRRMSNKKSMMAKRAEESEQQKADRRNIDKANKRAKESDSTKEVHKIRNKKAMASKRASSVLLVVVSVWRGHWHFPQLSLPPSFPSHTLSTQSEH